LHLSAERPGELTAAERNIVARSIQTFQLGESGQGRHILRVAREHSLKSGDEHYAEAMRLFIREEQRHGEYLGAFLDAERIPRIRKQWTNGVFYGLRHLVGLELTISILLTAELIAMVYYAALSKATNSATLKMICKRILKDEAAHILFQTGRLALMRNGRAWWKVRLVVLLEQWFFRGTCIAVWWTHYKVYQAAGIARRDFMRRAARELGRAHRLMDPRRIVAPGEADRPGQVRPARELPGPKTGNAGFLSRAN
jgi:hypothetical protein